jgi:hypothetical protein
MALSDAESKRRKDELDHRRGITPEVRRYNEIRAGVITGGVGVALAIFLIVFMNGLVLSGNVSAETAEILSRIWVVSVIPMLVGISLVINGVFVSKKLAEIARQAAQTSSRLPENDTNPLELRPADTTEFVSPFSVTEETTKYLSTHARKQ